MSRALRPVVRRRMAGLSLIELMVALVMALIVAAGIVTVFTSTSSSNKAQAQMVLLQEEGRFAIHSLRTDLASANGTYCSNSGGNATDTGASSGSGLFIDALRTPTVQSKADVISTLSDVTRTYPAATAAFALPSPLYMRGYECTTSACTPVDPNTTVSAIPAMGTAVGDRVVGASILTLRYLQPGSGWAVAPPSSAPVSTTLTADSDGTVTAVNLKPMAGEPPANHFVDGDLMLLADCSSSSVYTVTAAAAGSGTATLTPNNNYAPPLDTSRSAAPRVFDFSKDFQTLTYYLRVVCSDSSSPCDHTTGELVRRVNGTAQPLVRGVERLDFLYGVMDASGSTKFLTANELDTGVDSKGNTIACPPGIDPTLVDGMPGTTPATGCLWRAVQTIEVHILMDGQTPLYTLTPAEMNYIYTPDGSTVPTAPSAHAIKPKGDQGFPEHLLRREFVTLVSLRNFNP